MMALDIIHNGDCLEGLKSIPDGSIDLVVTDTPYELKRDGGAGLFGRRKRMYHGEIDALNNGIGNDVLRELVRVCKAPNIYVFCSKEQMPQLLAFCINNGLNYDILAWHKTNPVPLCSNKYLSDTEYIIFMRKGARLYGSYFTKRKYFLTPRNSHDKKKFGHPTIKPLSIISTLVQNSSKEGDVVLDPYMGSGTTAVACIQSHRHYIGFEINKEYFNTAQARILDEQQQLKFLP